jgi:hypothetical protein
MVILNLPSIIAINLFRGVSNDNSKRIAVVQLALQYYFRLLNSQHVWYKPNESD